MSNDDLPVIAAEPIPQKKKRPSVRLVIVITLAILAAILVLQNREPVETKIFWATVEMPRAVLLLTTFLIGVIVGLLATFIRKRHVSK